MTVPITSLEVVSFGCRLNRVESDAIAAQARADGIDDAVVFNTCAVTAEAVRQARQAIRKARRERPGSRLIVTGCAAQIDPASFAAMDEVDLIVGNAEKAARGGLLDDGQRLRVSDIMTASGAGAHLHGGTQERARAYVEVQNGCDHRCTFCIIPFGRGNSRSTPTDLVVSRVRDLALSGYAEVVLTGVDMTSWGSDLPGSPMLGQLVRQILAQVPQLARLRLSSIDTAEIDADLIEAMAHEPRLMPHLHLSLQSGDAVILKRMKRRHSPDDALALIAKVRTVRPDLAVGADFIAGFPTETQAAFENSCGLAVAAGLSYLHVFPFSPRPGTPAARMPQVPRGVVKARAARLRALADDLLCRHLTERVGHRVKALVERPGLARAEDFTAVRFDGEAQPGSLISGIITGHDRGQARVETWEMVG